MIGMISERQRGWLIDMMADRHSSRGEGGVFGGRLASWMNCMMADRYDG